jgi:outer membrane lipoprotein SlyB
MARRRFNRNQPRDRKGRWSKGGSGGGSKPSKKKGMTVYTQYTSFKRDGTVKKVGPIVQRELDKKGRFKSGAAQKAGVAVGTIAGFAVGATTGVLPVAVASASAGAAVGSQIGFRIDERKRIKKGAAAARKGR